MNLILKTLDRAGDVLVGLTLKKAKALDVTMDQEDINSLG